MKQNNLIPSGPDEATLASWKKEARQVKDDTIALATVSTSFGTSNATNPFTQLKIDIPKTDTAARECTQSEQIHVVFGRS
jgi:hypothetical protein